MPATIIRLDEPVPKRTISIGLPATDVPMTAGVLPGLSGRICPGKANTSGGKRFNSGTGVSVTATVGCSVFSFGWISAVGVYVAGKVGTTTLVKMVESIVAGSWIDWFLEIEIEEIN